MGEDRAVSLKHIPPIATCTNCGYSWIPRVPRPVKCPSCKDINWYRPRQWQGRRPKQQEAAQ